MSLKPMRFLPVAVVAGCLPVLAGCEDDKFTSTIFNPLNLKLPFLPYQEPVRIGMADHRSGVFDPANWDLTGIGLPWNPLRQSLERYLNQPVQVEVFKPFQIAAHLQSGRIEFALLGAGEYLATRDEFGDFGRVAALSTIRTRQGLIVARASSNIQTMEDIRGKRFAFGPQGDPVLDQGAKDALVAAGVSLDDIQRELLPVPTAFQHHISSREAAYEVVWGIGTEVGVIERAEYDAYPETGGSLLLRTFAKQNFRIVGETAPVRMETIPEGPLVVSPEADAALVARVTEYFLSIGQKQPGVLATMGLAGFQTPSGDVNAQLARMAEAAEPPVAPDEKTPATPQ